MVVVAGRRVISQRLESLFLFVNGTFQRFFGIQIGFFSWRKVLWHALEEIVLGNVLQLGFAAMSKVHLIPASSFFATAQLDKTPLFQQTTETLILFLEPTGQDALKALSIMYLE